MILPIYLYGSSCLREKTQTVAPDYPDLKQLIANMYDTMYNADGVGLAAPQIGRSIRLFVVDADPVKNRDSRATGFRQTFINPQILERSGEMCSASEGCLSIPDIHEEVVRNDVITVKYFDENFNEHLDTFAGIVARIVQHEYDHIEQILFPDHFSQLKKKLVRRKLDKIRTGKIQPEYRSRID
ncbi:MAG: peptide deformylase [Prevotellaceae bacterium]|jgi:peptide deformylase|nr:peptide deformylase [Prevotellaceae bacterium]